MEQFGNGDGDRVLRDAADIVEAGRDLETSRRRELEVLDELRVLDAQVAELTRRRESLGREAEDLRRREIGDEERIRSDLSDIVDQQTPAGGAGGQPGHPVPTATYRFYVADKPYETELASMTGRQIKAKVSDWAADHDLVLEGEGSAPNRIIGDDEVVDLAGAAHPLHFHPGPKANFG